MGKVAKGSRGVTRESGVGKKGSKREGGYSGIGKRVGRKARGGQSGGESWDG